MLYLRTAAGGFVNAATIVQLSPQRGGDEITGWIAICADDKAVDEFSALVRDYPGDTAGLANLAMTHLYRRDMIHALEDGRRASNVNPKNVIRRNNLALYQLYFGLRAAHLLKRPILADELRTGTEALLRSLRALGVERIVLGHADDRRNEDALDERNSRPRGLQHGKAEAAKARRKAARKAASKSRRAGRA